MAVRIQFRRGTAAEWTSANPTLAAGELGYETDNAQVKIGDGTTDWANLAYAAVSASYVDDAISNVVGLAPETLDTLNELAASIGDDSDFANTVASNLSNAISDHNDLTSNVHGISNTLALETTTGAQSKADSAQSNAASYTDNAIANLIDNSPAALDTLNELAAALGDDANFSTTVTNSLANKVSFIVDTQSNLSTANATSVANTIYIESDYPGYIRVGDGTSAYNDLVSVGYYDTQDQVQTHSSTTTNVHGIANTADIAYVSTDIANVQSDLSDHENLTTGVHGISNVADLLVTSDLETHNTTTTNVHGISDTSDLLVTADLDDHANVTINVHGISNTADLVVTSDLTDHTTATTNVHGIVDTSDLLVSQDLTDHAAETINVHGIANTAELVVTSDLGGATSTELAYIVNVSSDIQAQFDNIPNTYTSTADLANTYAPLADATLTGTVSLPSTTSIGDVSSTEIGYLNNVSSNIQEQLNAKLATSSASSIYAPIASPTLTGTVGLPADTSIGNVSATEISYLDNVSSNIQTQLGAKLASADAANTYAPIDGPTFTTSAALPADTTIGNVSATEISYLNNVTSAIQTQLDAKAPIANAIFTGSTEVVDITVTGDLTVQGTTTTVNTQNLSVRDNMLYLNADSDYTLSNAVGDGTNVVYTINETTQGSVGDFIIVSNTTPSSFDTDSDGLEIIAITSNTITVASTVTDTYVSGGNVESRSHANPDLGWAGGHYHDNTYQHAGVFLDATDQTFKFFDGYTPEPDADVFINTAHASFALAPIEVSSVTAENFTASNAVIFADNTVQTSAGVPSITGFTEKTASYTLDTLAHQDNVVEMNNANAITFTIPTNAALAWPVGASMDIIQTNTGQVTIANAVGVELNYTPGNKLRTQWSSCTIMKRGTDSWIVYGDLTA